MNEDKIIIEKSKRFSQSKIWDMQRDYFDKLGILAWSGHVPFYVTSNPFIANKYVQMTMDFISECAEKKLLYQRKPIYIIELGTGHGKFSFYILKEIFKLQKKMGLDKFKICYVMTDFTLNNLKYWKDHKALKPYIDAGQLDFSIFNLEETQSLNLIYGKRELKFEKKDNPLVVFANYIFDTVTQDAFAIKNKIVMESRISLYSNKKSNNKNDIENIKVEFQDVPIKQSPYYENLDWENLLNSYKETLNNTYFLIPTGSLKCLDTLLRLSKNKLFLIASDKAYIHLDQLKNKSNHTVTFHSSISLMANFHAIGEFFRLKKGMAFHQKPQSEIKTSVFISGFPIKSFVRTQESIEENIQDLSAADFFILYTFVKNNLDKANFESINSLLKFSHYCPHVFSVCCEKIMKEIINCDQITLESFSHVLDKIADNFYYLPSIHNSLYHIADVFKEMKFFEKSIFYFQESIKYFGETEAVVAEIGICLYELGKLELALEKFKLAATLTNENDYLLENIKIIETQLLS